MAMVSIIMPAYNASRTLDRAVGSVISQTWPDWELIIAVDCSPDDTHDKALVWSEADQRVRVICNDRNLGVALTRNVALDLARGDYIAFLDSDDSWEPEKLALQISSMEKTGARVSYTAYRRLQPTGKSSLVVPPLETTYGALLRGNCIAMSSAVYLRHALEDYRFRSIGHEDYLFWLRLLSVTGKAERVEDSRSLMTYSVGDGSISGNKLKSAVWQWRIYRQHLGIPLFKSLYLFFNYALAALEKRR